MMVHILPSGCSTLLIHTGLRCKAFGAIALVLVFGAIYRMSFPYGFSSSVWFSLSFVSQISSASLVASEPNLTLKKPGQFALSNVGSGSLTELELEPALPPAFVNFPPSEGQPIELHSKPLPYKDSYIGSDGTSFNKTALESSEHEKIDASVSDNGTNTNQTGVESSENEKVNASTPGNGTHPDGTALESSEHENVNSSTRDVGPYSDQTASTSLGHEKISASTPDDVIPILEKFESSNEILTSQSSNLMASEDRLTSNINVSSNPQKDQFGLAAFGEENVTSDDVTSGLSSSEVSLILRNGSQPSPRSEHEAFLPLAKESRVSVEATYPKYSSPSVEKPAWVSKLDDDLCRTKDMIDNAALMTNSDLYPPVYHNVTKFSKSYEMMEKIFRIYIYREGKFPLVHDGPTMGIYASEGRFIRSMERNNQFIAKDPKEAHMFFLPYSVVNMVTKLYVPGSHSMLPLATFIKDYVNLIASKHPYWNRTQGADHFFVSCHDWGPATARDHQELRHNAIKVVCNADLTEEYVLEKDASLPEIYMHSSAKRSRRVRGLNPKKRPYLAFFAGQLHGRVRPVLLQYWKDKDPDMKIYEVLPSSIAKKIPYAQHMKLSRFCICAMGYEVNSPRIVEAIYNDCVPVIIADNFVLPFSDVLNWDTFSVTIQEKDISNLKTILLNISERRYHAMQSRLKHVRRHFMWNDSPIKYDVFHMILHSVWLRRLHQLQCDQI